MKHYIKTLKKTPIGEIAIIWTDKNKLQIEEIILSTPIQSASEIANEKYDKLINKKKTPKKLKKLIKEMNKYFNEKEAKFTLEYLNMDKLTDFQRKVLLKEFETEKGSINTYGSLAKAIDNPKAYRAVGTALAKNPFPIIIPCHRTVKSDRTLGGFNGFQGGLESKEILLDLEGIEIEQHRIISESHILSLDKKKQTKITKYCL